MKFGINVQPRVTINFSEVKVKTATAILKISDVVEEIFTKSGNQTEIHFLTKFKMAVWQRFALSECFSTYYYYHLVQ